MVRTPDGKSKLVVVERAAKSRHAKHDIDDWIECATRIGQRAHPYLNRMTECLERADEALVVYDFVDGNTLDDLMQRGPIPIAIGLRILVDVLNGLDGLHGILESDGIHGCVHGRIAPDYVLARTDGRSVVLDPGRMRSNLTTGNDGAYSAPEVLLADEPTDSRADIYSAGVILWEILSNRALFANMPASAIATHVLGGQLPRATVPKFATWAEPLVDVTVRAMSPNPSNRFASGSELGHEVERISGAEIAPSWEVAEWIEQRCGKQIRDRRAMLEQSESPTAELEPFRVSRPGASTVALQSGSLVPTPKRQAKYLDSEPPTRPRPSIEMPAARVPATPSPLDERAPIALQELPMWGESHSLALHAPSAVTASFSQPAVVHDVAQRAGIARRHLLTWIATPCALVVLGVGGWFALGSYSTAAHDASAVGMAAVPLGEAAALPTLTPIVDVAEEAAAAEAQPPSPEASAEKAEPRPSRSRTLVRPARAHAEPSNLPEKYEPEGI